MTLEVSIHSIYTLVIYDGGKGPSYSYKSVFQGELGEGRNG